MPLKLSENFQKLQEPKFILYAPVPLQLGVLALLILAPTVIFIWLYKLYLSGQFLLAHWFVGAITLVLFTSALRPKSWQLWANFAADPKGVYIYNKKRELTFIPWAKIGEAYIGMARSGIMGQTTVILKTVILKVKLSDQEWHELVGKSPLERFCLQKDALGYRPLGIGNNARNNEQTLASIQRIRMLSGHT